MIHEFARCPYCDDCVLAIDDQLPAFLINPESAAGQACPHLVLATVCLDLHSPRTSVPAGRTGVWRWSLDEGLVGPKADGDPLGDYLTDLACEGLAPEFFPTIPHRLVGVYAAERESKRLGWGYFPMNTGEKVLTGLINGWALYSLRPEALMAEIRGWNGGSTSEDSEANARPVLQAQ